MFRCDHCDTTMTGAANYQQHIEGKKHLKKLKSLGTLAVNKNTAENNVQETAPAYAGNFVKPEGEDKKAETTTASPPPKPVNTAEILGTSNADPVMNAVKANMLGKLPLKRAAYDKKCDVCNIEYSSPSHEEQHLSGKKHQKKVQAKELEATKSATLYCGFCNLHANSIEQMEQHRNGSAHKKKVDKAQQQQQQAQHSAAKKKFVPSSGAELSDRQIMPPPPTAPPKLEPLSYDK